MMTSYDSPSSIEACGSTSTLPKQRNGAAWAATMLTLEQRVSRLARSSCRGRRRRPIRGRRTVRTGSRVTSRARRTARHEVSADESDHPRQPVESLLPRFHAIYRWRHPTLSGTLRGITDGRDRGRPRSGGLGGHPRRHGSGLDRGVGRARGGLPAATGCRRRPRGRRRRIRRGAGGLERDDRPPSRRHRALPGHGRRRRGGPLRRRARPAGGDPRRRPQRRRARRRATAA